MAPLRSDRLHTLPPTLVVTAEHDPLRDEGELLAAQLAEHGVDVVGTRYLGQVHGFWRHPQVFPQAEPLMRQVAGFLRSHL
jgi:acetyl esterase